jgi:CubicO group peptidase (beta-lactamase class C family)
MRQLFSIFIIFLNILPVSGQQRQQQFDSLFDKLYKDNKFNGNVLIAEKGEVIYKKSFGLANEKTKAALNENSVFELASCSKQFTAMAIAILNKQKKLKYDDAMSAYIPELEFYKGISIRHLLNHTSGLPDYMMLFDSLWDKKKIATNADIISLFKKHKPALLFEPNSKYEYSNTGYAMLAAIIERVSRTSYNNFLSANIFEPLKMNNSLVYTRRYQPMDIKNYAFGYVYDGSKKALPDSLKEYDIVYYLDGIKGDGSVNSTVNDLLAWDRALYGNQLLSEEEKLPLFSPAVLSDKTKSPYGFGWGIENNKNFGKIVSHTGGWPGYITYIERDLDSNNTIIILQNTEKATLPIQATRKILYRLADKPAVKRTAIELPDSVLASYVGSYELAPSFVIKITKTGNQLKAQATGQGILDLYAEKENYFFLKVVDAQVEFVKDAAGKVIKLILHQNGRDAEGMKTE